MDFLAIFISSANFLILILAIFIPNYIKQKATNKAQKEDLEELTNIVEQNKVIYAAKIEQLRAELQLVGDGTERRRKIYERLAASLQIFIQSEQHSKEENILIAKEFYSSYAAAWLWASEEVLEALNVFLQSEADAKVKAVPMKERKQKFTNVMLAMRKDAGFKDTNVAEYQFVGFT